MLIAVYYLLAAILVGLSFKSFLGGVRYLQFFRGELAKPPSNYIPFVSVIVPCRGIDEGLAGNLAALLGQDYPNFEVIFVVDDRDDPAVQMVEKVKATHRSGSLNATLIVAAKAVRCSQKIENLREAVLHTSPDAKVLVFADSDARPSNDWLRDLLAPLADESVGAATGYRWFISERPNFASQLRSVWNASIASALGPNRRSNFCWGGSTAIRRDTFDRLNVREKWSGVVSDDFTLTDAVRSAGLGIAFVPKALNASVGSCTLPELLEFTNRQMKITRVYATPLWLMTLIGTGLFNVVMFGSLAIVMFSRLDILALWIAVLTIALISIFSVGKASLRLAAVRLAMTDHQAALKRQLVAQNTLWLVSPALFFINSVAALFSRRITWRGTTYELKSRTETVIVDA